MHPEDGRLAIAGDVLGSRAAPGPGCLRRVAGAPRGGGRTGIDDLARASSQFFTLLKGEPHAQLVFGCSDPLCAQAVQAHLAATVDLFLRAYAPSRR